MSNIIDVRGLSKYFGSVAAARDIDVAIQEGETVGVIGSNGAGKTTFVNMITGYITPSAGTIHFCGREVTGMNSRQITKLGLARSFQIPQVFASMSVFENLLLAMGIAEREGSALWRPLRSGNTPREVEAMLKLYRISDYAHQDAGSLPQGIRKLLDIAMAVVRKPKAVMLDEPTSGISVEEKFDLMDVVMDALREQGVTVLFIEHDMDIVARYATRVLAFYDGTILADGPPDQALSDPQVQELVIGHAVATTPSVKEKSNA